MKKLIFISLICVISLPAFAVTGDVTVEGYLQVVGSSSVLNSLAVGTPDVTGLKLKVWGGGFGVSTDNSTAVAPATAAFVDLTTGEYCRFTFGDDANAFQNGFGQAMDIYSYHTLRLIGGKHAVGSVAYSTESNIGVHVINTDAAVPPLVVDGAAAQTANLQEWRSNTPTVLSAVNAAGNLGLGIAAAGTHLHVYDNNANTEPSARIEQAGTGDSALRFYHSAATALSATIGLDQSDNKNIKISNTNTLTGTTYADANTMLRIHTETGSEGITDINHQSRIRAYRNATQSIANTTWTKVQLNTKSYDEKTEFDNATNYRFTAKEDGYYQVNGCVSFSVAVAAAQTNSYCAIYKGGAAYAYGSEASIRGTPQISVVGDVVYLAATEYVELYVYHNFGAAQNTTAGTAYTYMSVHKIS
jgi:hypothetical protein